MINRGFFFGVDYYPEHWPRERWPLDAKLMGEAKFNVVRLAEFAWCRLEPKPNVFDFAWLDEALEILAGKGLKAVLGTPTAAPPPWLVKQNPDILPVDFRGHPMPPVARRHYCPNNPNYREATKRIVTKLAEHYRDDERVIGYQVDNELSMGEEHCYCNHCIEGFREWLRGKYDDNIKVLNKVYGTIFWSQEYSDWSEVHPPTPPFSDCNRALALDWFRFKSESMVKYLELQVGILKKLSPRKFVTTNLPGALHSSVNCFDMGARLDFMSWDCYPRFASGSEAAQTSLQHDAARVMGREGRFWVMELQGGPTDGYFNSPIGYTPEPGELRKWAYQAIAHGVEGVVYFRWRTACFGREQYWHGILNHDGEVNRRYLEVKELGEELERVTGEVAETRFESRVAVVFSYDSLWATLIERGFYCADYYSQVLATYRELWRLGVNTDVIPPTADLSKYKVVFVPFLYLTDNELNAKLKEYVKGGGLLVASARTSVKNENNNVYCNGLPGELVDLFGARIVDYTTVCREERALITVERHVLQAFGWLEELKPTTAEVIGLHEFSWLKGKPAITLNQFGKGLAVYVGSFLTPELASYVTSFALKKSDVNPPANVEGAELEVTLRYGDSYALLFLINHSSSECQTTVTLPDPCKIKGLLTGVKSSDGKIKVSLKPHGVEILKIT
ncbi:MAG: beta-galactosidase [Thermofilaceae archaeon]